MWSNKPSSSAPRSGESPKPESVEDLQALGHGEVRRDGRGVAGGLRIVGEIQGREDFYIAGQVSGSVFLPDCAIHVGPKAEVNANLTGRVIEVEGQVVGDLTASERIAIRSSGTVTGDVLSPQIQIDEGCKFKGSVQMREPEVQQQAPAGPQLAAGAKDFQAANE